MLRHVAGGGRALGVIAAADAEHVLQAALGEAGIGRGRGDLDDAGIGVDIRCRDRGAGAVVAGHEHHALVGEVVGHAHRLLGVAPVVADGQLDLLAQYATLGVDVGDGFLGALAHLLADRGLRAGHRAGDADLDVGPGAAAAKDAGRGNGEENRLEPVHESNPTDWTWLERRAEHTPRDSEFKECGAGATMLCAASRRTAPARTSTGTG